MSTKKVKDVPKSQAIKAKRTTETTKKETKSRTSTRLLKKDDTDEEKKRKISTLQSSTRSQKAAPKKTSTAKPASSRALTPPSNRVVKTQFFPSKNMYSNALKRTGKNTKDKKPSEVVTPRVKNLKDVSPDTSSISERPRTATLRKGSIVNKNIAGPEAPKNKAPIHVKSDDPSPTEYEDDFDSYESDFEEYDSSDSNINLSTCTTSSESESIELKSASKRASSAGTDDEKKLDSGNYELPDSRHRQILDNIKESIEKENANLNSNHNRSNLGSLSDEGFEESKSLQFINFLGAQKKYQHRKSVELRRKRGEEILSMIRLDQYNFTLYDAAPVPYEIFIKSFGKSNSVQISVQTEDDNLNEEVQTDEILYRNKWTQCPPTFTQINDTNHFWQIYKCNYLGVGCDVLQDQKIENIFNENNLEKFLLNAGNLILDLQAEENVRINAQNNKSNIPFSKSCIRFDTKKIKVLQDRLIKDVCFCSSNSNKILTVHGENKNDEFPKSIVCLWSLSNVDSPETTFFTFGDLTCCAFNKDTPSLIFGGLTNGSVVVWDTKENSSLHKICDSENNLIRSPTYSTEINYGHCFKVISIKSILNSAEEALFLQHKSAEICSLDEDGSVVVWSVIFKEKSCGRIVENQGLAHWGSVILTINTKISLRNLHPEINDFRCTDLGISYHDSDNLYISTSYGIIIHCLAKGGRTSVKKLLPDKTSQANCIEMCPYFSEFLLTGFDNGDINLYSRIIEKPLKILSNKDSPEWLSKIKEIQWSHNRPFIFYTRDVSNTIHVWNLKVSDLFPNYSIPFKDRIVCMKLSPLTTNDTAEATYLLIASENFVDVHLLNEEHDQQPTENFQNDREKLFNYINRYI